MCEERELTGDVQESWSFDSGPGYFGRKLKLGHYRTESLELGDADWMVVFRYGHVQNL